MQTSYGDMKKGFAGMLADIGDNRIDSYAAESTIPLGSGVVHGTNQESQVKLPDADTGFFAGVCMIQAKEMDAGGTVIYKVGDTVPVLTKGRAWVTAKGSVMAGQDAHLIASGADSGKFTATNSASTITTGAKFKTSTVGDGITQIQL